MNVGIQEPKRVNALSSRWKDGQSEAMNSSLIIAALTPLIEQIVAAAIKPGLNGQSIQSAGT